ncbi:30S ribosomal protein S20 [Candidatus Microgenomates bacterium]|nr:30S ribosomal protein S20 [Candidatus Microgenomates bacterium]
MPQTKSAKRALRASKDRRLRNAKISAGYKKAIKLARAKNTPSLISTAYQTLDMAAKIGVIHWKKAARLKSQLAKAGQKTPSSTTQPKVKKSSKNVSLKSIFN